MSGVSTHLVRPRGCKREHRKRFRRRHPEVYSLFTGDLSRDGGRKENNAWGLGCRAVARDPREMGRGYILRRALDAPANVASASSPVKQNLVSELHPGLANSVQMETKTDSTCYYPRNDPYRFYRILAGQSGRFAFGFCQAHVRAFLPLYRRTELRPRFCAPSLTCIYSNRERLPLWLWAP